MWVLPVFVLTILFSYDNSLAFVSKKTTLHQNAVQLAREGNYDKALQLLQVALKETGNAPEVLSDFIVILSWNEQFHEAIRNYENLAQRINPPNYVILEAARCYRLTGQYDTAISLYQTYLGREKNIEAVKGLGLTYYAAKKPHKARQFIDMQIRMDKENAGELQLFLADNLLREKKFDDAEKIYGILLEKHPHHLRARIGMSKVYIRTEKYKHADILLNGILIQYPENLEALFAKGELLEAQKDDLAAYRIYDKILKVYPDSQAAKNLKIRAMLNLGANSAAQKKLYAPGERIDPDIHEMLLENEAKARIQWKEPEQALAILTRNQDYVETRLRSDVQAATDQPYYTTPLGLRTYWDNIVVLHQKKEMKEVIKRYEESKQAGLKPPPWVLKEIGSAYLYLEQPETALSLYEETLASGWDPDGETSMGLYFVLVELGRYQDAEDLLNKLEANTPDRVANRGVLEDNWRKSEIILNRAWLLLYQDRLSEAQDYLDTVLDIAPFNTNFRTALARTYLWRDWPRKALEEYEISITVDPKDIVSLDGHCLALNENDKGNEARQLAKELLEKEPKNKHVQDTNRYLKIQDMRLLTLDAYLTDEYPGVEDTYLSVRVDQPIRPWRKLFAEFVHRNIRSDDFDKYEPLGRAGIDFRLSRDWWFAGGLTAELEGNDSGFFTTVRFDPNDFFSFSTLYDSYSLSTPAEAVGRDIVSREWGFNALYRQSERFFVAARTSGLFMSDDNNRWSYNLLADTALSTRAYWKTRVALEGSLTTHSKTDVPYFSPEYYYSVYVTPMVEHTWYKRYERFMKDRLFVGVGEQWQKDYASRIGYRIRYEQDYQLTHTTAFLIGAVFSDQSYDGEYTDEWNFYLTFKQHF